MFSIPARPTVPTRIASLLKASHQHIPLDFITLHYVYYIATCMLSAVIFWCSSTPPHAVSFTDSLFLVISAMTQAGLNTVNLSQINTWQQIMLFFLMLFGSAILISCAVVHTRKRAFEKRFASVIEKERQTRRATKSHASSFQMRSRRRNLATRVHDTPMEDNTRPTARSVGTEFFMQPATIKSGAIHDEASIDPTPNLSSISQPRRSNEGVNCCNQGCPDVASGPSPILRQLSAPTIDAREHLRFLEEQSNGKVSASTLYRDRLHYYLRSPSTPFRDWSDACEPHEAPCPSLSSTQIDLRPSTSQYFDSDGVVGRNSQFYSLSAAERERLGGVEYRAVVLLEYIVVMYFILFQLLGCIGLGAWIAYNDAAATLTNGLNPWWTGAFLGVSAFNNNGMNLVDANMVAFQSSLYVLVTAGFLILAGNTSYPVFLRLILWTLHQFLPKKGHFQDYRQTLKFLLDHPRRCYTNLFPSSHTWWLVGSLFVLNGIDWMAFEVLNISNTSIYISPGAPKALDGLFQAVAVRSGGFYVVPIANLRIGLLVLYVFMMYISVYPVTITMRNSNVYEERSLGIYADDPIANQAKEKSRRWPFTWTSALGHPYKEGSRAYFVRQQLRGQLAHDLWWICLAVLFITIVETGSFDRDPVTFAVFNIIFETVSAYGCVGISTGAPGVNYSFCGEWHVLSKLILCAVMIRGRHRGLPVTIDRAVLLPGEYVEHAEEEDAVVRHDFTHERMRSRNSRDVIREGCTVTV